MKLTTLLMILGCLHVHAAVFSQTISLTERNVSLETIFDKIEQQSGFSFFYNMELIRSMPKVNVKMKNVNLEEALSQFLGKLSLDFEIVDKTVVIKSFPTISYKKIDPRVYIGKVLDEKGLPMPGVTVRIKGTNLTVVTNKDGQFITPVITDLKAVLQISYIGYQSQEISVSDLKAPIIITLRLASSDLDQVQITAYGSTTKRLSTGNITTITAEEIAKNPSRNVLEIVQGHVPGLFVQQQSGLPGTPFNLMIRGQQTLTGGIRPSQPLIVVNGVALSGESLPLYQNNGTNELLPERLKGGNPLDYIDPSTIESVTVLKDADATSIYGSRGAYGVILITTKKGKPGTPRLDVNATMGVTMRGTSPELLNTEQYIMLRKEAYVNDGVDIPQNADILGPDANRYTDFQKELAGNHAAVNRINASYSGGTQDINFLIGGNYRKQTSIQIGKGSVRDGGLNFNINNNTKNNKLSIGLSGSYLSTTDDAVPYDFSQSNSVTSPPNAAPLFLPDGSLNWETGSNAAAAMNIIFKNITNNLFSNATLRYTPVRGLSVNTNVSYNNMNSKELKAQPTSYYAPGSNFRTTSTLNLYNIRNITFDPNISYEFKMGPKGKLMAQAGSTLQNQLSYQTYTTGNDFLSDDMLYNPAFADPLTAAGQVNVTTFYDQNPAKYLSFFGILNYNWADKYLLNLNGKRDGSTKFGENYRFGNFGSVGASWIVSSETWFESLLPVLSFVKLSGSIGTSGGDGIPNYSYLTTYNKSVSYQGNIGLKASGLENKDLHWEHNRKSELSLYLQFFNGRIGLNSSYYSSLTTDQLVNQLLPSTTGFAGRQINSPAVIKNWGYEFELRTQNINTKAFHWNTNFNFTIPKNKLVEYPGLETVVTNTNYMLGKPVQGVRVYNYAGVDPETGFYNFINREGVKGTYRLLVDPVTLDQVQDKTEFIDLTPKFYGGMNNTFSYKNLSLDVFFTFTDRMGKTFLGSQNFPAGWPGQNLSTSILDRWQKPGDQTDVQKAGAGLSTLFAQNNFVSSTGAYARAFYVRLNSVNMSYALSDKLTKQIGLRGLSIFAQGSNLLTISKYGDLDPENLGAGMAPLRNFSGGLRITL